MERKGFFKSLATLIAAPTLIGNIKEVPKNVVIENKQPTKTDYPFDTLRIYLDNVNDFVLSDMVISDLSSKAMVTNIYYFKPTYIEIKPIIRGKYEFKDVTKVVSIRRFFSER